MSQADAMGSRGWIISYVLSPTIETEDDIYYSNRQRIHNAIVQNLANGVFLPASYNVNDREMVVPDAEESRIYPKTVIANDVSSAFGQAKRNRRSRIEERHLWIWHVIVAFDQEAVLDVFEQTFIQNPILLPRDRDRDLLQVEISLKSAEYIHPPKQQPSSGTQVTYVLEARLGQV